MTRAQQPLTPGVQVASASGRDGTPTPTISTASTARLVTQSIAAELPSGAPRAPERFGRYVLLERMGEGGMAEVFRAVVPGAEGFRRQVVLKRILASHASAPAFVEMFAQEARISAMLHHPNIVQVFDFGQVDGSYFLAMELLDGWEVGTINKTLRAARAKMPIEVALHVAHEVLLGLSYAHTLKVQGYQPHIVHRDVSPSNIMCLRTGGVKLLDFGVASVAGAGDGAGGKKPAFCGKLSYAAPEYVQGHGLDARIDLFAVGVILWEMLVGERLFRGPTDRHTLAALLDGPILPPSVKRPAVPAEVDRIVMRALEREPAQRYQTAATMAEDLEQVLSERRYQSQMLPRLLANLFSDQPHEEPGSVTGVEELIQSGATIPPAPLSRHLVLPPSSGWVLRFLGGVGAALVVLAAVFAATWPSSRRQAARAPVATAPAPRPASTGARTRAPSQAAAPSPTTVRAPSPAAPSRLPFAIEPLLHTAPAEPPALSPLPPVPPLTPSPRAAAPLAPALMVAEPARATRADRHLRPPPGARHKVGSRRSRATPGAGAGAGNLMAGDRPIDPFVEAASRTPRR